MAQTVPGIRTRWSNGYITATHWSGYRVRVPRDWSKGEEEEHEAAARECLRRFARSLRWSASGTKQNAGTCGS